MTEAQRAAAWQHYEKQFSIHEGPNGTVTVVKRSGHLSIAPDGTVTRLEKQ